MNEPTNERHIVPAAMSVAGFCQAYGISRAFLYKLWKAGKGPRYSKKGRRTLITPEAGFEWLAGTEVQSREGA